MKSSNHSDPEHVFLICSERSGSNLIRVILGCHPEIYAPPPMHLGRDLGRSFYTLTHKRGTDPAWQMAVDEVRKRAARLFGEDCARDICEQISETEPSDFGAWLDLIYRVLMTRESGKRILLLKENNIHTQVFFLLHYFPNAKFVFQVRDPRDYLASVRARRKGWLGNKYGSTRRALEVWRDDQLGGLNILAHLGPERVFLQRYEDLISDPSNVLTNLCTFLDLDYSPSMLEFHRDESVTRIATEGGPWENLSRPLMSDNSQTYKRKLGKFHVRIVETYLGALMDLFGYTRALPMTRKPGFLPTFLPQITEPLERLVNSQRQPFYVEEGSGFSKNLESHSRVLVFTYAKK